MGILEQRRVEKKIAGVIQPSRGAVVSFDQHGAPAGGALSVQQSVFEETGKVCSVWVQR
jgi:hypothetical protein